MEQVPEHPLLLGGGYFVNRDGGQRLPVGEELPAQILELSIRNFPCQKVTNRLGQHNGMLGNVIVTSHRNLLSLPGHTPSTSDKARV
ncbi:hypothetical protein D3C72_2241970 [compost metagenome]